MKNFKLYFKSIVQRKARWLLTILAFLTLGVGEMWADKDFWSTNAWNFKYYNGGSDTWIGDQNMGATYNLGVQSTLYFKGTWVKTWWNDDWGTNNVTMYYGFESNTKSVSNDGADSQWDADGKKQCYWEFGADYDMISNAPNSVGQNTMWVNWSIDNWRTSSTCYINFTIPGFTDLSTTEVTFDNTTVGSSSTKSITYTHYGTAPTNVAARYSITGDDAGIFSITALSGTGATIQFAPTTAGTKTATLVINDVHGKQTSSISLTGTTQYTVSYQPGSYSSGSTINVNKVYGTNLTLKDKGDFSRTGYTQTAWNTNANGTSGTNYNLKATYSTEADLTLYPTWTVNNYNITYSPVVASHCTYTTTPANANYGSTVNLTITPAANYVISSVTAEDASSNPVSVTGTSPNYSFTMPASNVTVTVETALSSMTVTLNAEQTNHGSLTGVTASQTYAYGDATQTVSALPPGADGYKFMGYYTETGGGGTKLINADGTWIASVAGYTDEDGKWVHGSSVTLYAYYQAATITNLELPGGDVYTVGGAAFTATPTVSAFDGNAVVCWQVLNSSSEEVTTTFTPTSGNSVTVSIPSTPGNYTLKAVLHAGTGCGGNELHTAQASFTVQGSYTVSISNGQVAADNAATSVSVGEVTTGTAYANNAAEGKKFVNWTWTPADKLTLSECEATDRSITFNASAAVTLTANYTDRSTKKVYFASPGGWDNIYAYTWKSSDDSDKNAAFPGVEITSNTEVVNCVTYYVYEYYDEPNGTGDAGHPDWDRVVFNKGTGNSEYPNTNWDKTKNFNIADGHFYRAYEDANSTGRTDGHDWYLEGTFNDVNHWDFSHPIDIDCETGIGYVDVADLTATSQSFKIYQASTNTWYSGAGMTVGVAATLSTPYDANCTVTPAAAGTHRFTFNTGTKELTIRYAGADPDLSATIRTDGTNGASVSSVSILHQYTPTTITATVPEGYHFAGWTHDGSHGIRFADASSATTTVTATSAGGIITANFTNEGVIYFDRTAVNGVWAGSDVYVTFFTNNEHWEQYNDESHGKGQRVKMTNYVSTLHNLKMNRIPNTNIYYLNTNGAATQWYMFTDKNMPSDNETTWNQAAVARADYSGGINMFVVENYVEKTVANTGYYYGYWMKYNETGSGIKLHVYNTAGTVEVSGSPIEFTTTNAGDRQFTASISLSASTNYKFKVEGFNGIWYGNNGTMTSSNSTAWDFVERVGSNCNFNTTGSGSYKFTLVCTDAGKLKVSLEFPLDRNDYRLVYNGKIDTEGSAHAHPSDFIRNVANGGSGKDTVSFFVTDDGSGDDFSLTLQKCTAVSPSVTWGNACDDGHTLTANQLGLTGKTGVYYFVLEQNQDDGCSGVKITDIQEYTGDYYIRTDAAGGGWEAYETTPDNKMEYSSYAKEHSGYDYYYCHWTPTGKNIHFTIANDYSPCITDTFTSGVTPFNFENMPYEASVRFMYNSETNVIGRVYLNGSNDGTTEYLSLHAMNDSIRIDASTPIDKSGSENHLKLQDMGNWIYQKDIQVQEGTHYRLISNYRFNGADHLQYFKGKDGTWNESTTELLLGGSSNTYQTLRLVYDFKTNHLMAAWLVPESGNSPALALETNVMILQQNQDTARQITFAGSDALTEIDTVYSTINLTKDFLQNTNNSEAARQFFYVSFPYDVDLSDVFGSVGEYGVDWAIQWYDGKKRAREGFWADSEPNWKFFETAKGSTLRAYEGYVLTLNLSKFLDDSKWKYGVTDIYLYFPSKDKIGTIHNESSKTVRIMPEDETATDYTCTINRATPDGDRTRKDSHWHCIGSPSFARNSSNTWNTHDGTSEDWKAKTLPFLYEWNSASNTLAPVASGGAYKFKPLAAYLVQYEGPTITWTNVVTVANPIVARRAPETPDKETTFKLSLMRGEEKMDQTFVRISDNEAVTSGFEFGQDLCKEFQRGANIYTIVENTEVAGNSLPLETEKTTIVPVGIRIATAGEYTFAMPEGTNGTGVVLVDTENGTRTNLALGDYTVTLGAGTTDGRFVLEISPVANTPTGIGNVQGDNVPSTNVRKVMVDGVLYIVKDGKAYDARGTRVE